MIRGMTNMRTACIIGAVAIALAALPVHAEEKLSHGRFAAVTLPEAHRLLRAWRAALDDVLEEAGP